MPPCRCLSALACATPTALTIVMIVSYAAPMPVTGPTRVDKANYKKMWG
ncbi:hypothetical protein [Streptomyces sp. NPDC056549]